MGFPGLPVDHVWHFLGQWGWANVDWCEETVAGYVTEPATAWSNVAFLVSGAAIYATSGVRKGHPLLRILPAATVALGLLSGFYHATNAWVTQLGDFLGMYLVAGIPLLIGLERFGFRRAGTFGAYAILNAVAMAATIVGHRAGFPIQAIFAVFLFGTIALELALRARDRLPSYRDFAYSLASFGIAGACSAADVTRTVCDPTNHIVQGHALWHVGCAIGIYFMARHVRQVGTMAEIPRGSSPSIEEAVSA
ncbi:MAG: ceramidase domain-containing protein [Bdellovibrionales bacterium]|nr:ceramidase domain-containing protein [Bdellovibrionales bacterium]